MSASAICGRRLDIRIPRARMRLEKTGVGFVFEFSEISANLPPKVGPIYEPGREAFIALTAILISLIAAVLPIRKAMKLTVRESCMET
jgi:hypothetical protein